MKLLRKHGIRSIICFAMMVILLFGTSVFCFAEPKSTQDADPQSETQQPFTLSAKSAILMDALTGEVLYSIEEHKQLFPASVTKIMPLLLVMEALDSGTIDLSDTVMCSADAASKGGSQIWLEEGETMTVDELLRATAIGSANDACCALGELIAGSEQGFVQMMNDRATQLGMADTHFDNCTGLDDETDTHLTSAYDIAVMSRELLKHERITSYTTKWMDSLRNGETELVNTNKLVRFYNGTTGLKTGTTAKAGFCVSASALRDGTHLIAVVLGSDNSTNRFEDAKTMLNWGFSSYETITPQIDKALITDVNVIKGVTDVIKPVISEITPITLKKGASDNLEQDVVLVTDVEAPVEVGQKLGTVTLTLDGETVGEYELTAGEQVDRLSFIYVFLRLLSSFGKNGFVLS